MGVSGCTTCQAGSVEALKAYDQAFEARRNEAAARAAKAQEEQQPPQAPGNQAGAENRPIAGAVVGSVINTSA